MVLGFGIAGAVLVFVAIVLSIVFSLVRRAARERLAEYRAELSGEGIVRDSGLSSVTVRYRNYRSPGYAATANIHRSSRQLVLTRKSFAILGARNERCPLDEVSRYQVGAEGNVLRLVTDEPVGATGHVDLRFTLVDAAEWTRALRDAGAKELPPS